MQESGFLLAVADKDYRARERRAVDAIQEGYRLSTGFNADVEAVAGCNSIRFRLDIGLCGVYYSSSTEIERLLQSAVQNIGYINLRALVDGGYQGEKTYRSSADNEPPYPLP